MCDPVSLIVGAVAGSILGRKGSGASAPAAAATPDPAAERAAAEAEAAQKANARIANDQRRRREQGSLLAKGAPSFTLGDPVGTSSPELSPIGGGAFASRSSTARSASLISQGAPGGSFGGGGGGGSSRTRVALQ